MIERAIVPYNLCSASCAANTLICRGRCVVAGRIPLPSSASTKHGKKPRAECLQPSTGNRPDAQPLVGTTGCTTKTCR